MTHTPDESVRAALYSEAKSRGNSPVARELGVPGATLTSYLARLSRPGTAALIEQRFHVRGREIAESSGAVQQYAARRRGKSLGITHT